VRVLLLRHPQSLHNASGHWAGFIDSPLTEKGRAEAVVAARRWSRQGYHWIVSSDLQRASESASIMARLMGLKTLQADPDFRERNAGEWQGRLVSALKEDPEYKRWAGSPTGNIPGGEPYPAFRKRLLRAFANTVLWSGRNGGTIVVAHDGVQQCLAKELGVEGYPWSPLCGPEITSFP